jgi:hypothetical protein
MNQTTKGSKKSAKKAPPAGKRSIELPLTEEEHAALSRIADMHNTSPHGVLLHFGLRDVVNRAIGSRGNFDRALGETTWEGQA